MPEISKKRHRPNRWLIALPMAVAALGCGDAGSTNVPGASVAFPPAPIEETTGNGSCTGAPGERRAERLVVDGTERIFDLFVPSSYACTRRTPLWLEFHGAYGGEEPERAYLADELPQIAEKHGVILARLRSESSEQAGHTWYFWDRPAGALERNQRFALALVEQLTRTHAVDRTRVWASGYSSGGNMALSLLGLQRSPFRAIGAVAAGLWSRVKLPSDFGPERARVYTATGYRDLHYPWLRSTVATLRTGGYDDATLFERETDDGHSYLPWHVDEMIGWFASGERPKRSEPARGAWRRISGPSSATLLEATRAADGNLVVGDTAGAVWRKSAGGWEQRWKTDAPIVALASYPTGTVAAASQSTVALSPDSASTFFPTSRLPVDPNVGIAYVNGLALTATQVTAAGSAFFGGTSGELAWSVQPLGGADVQAVAATSAGTWLGAGRFGLIVRAALGQAPRPVRSPVGDDVFLHAVAAADDSVVIVGQDGVMLRSVDDGATFTALPRVVTQDLYAVAFNGAAGLAVGAHGAAVASDDGGASWRDVSFGEDVMLAGAAFTDVGRACAVGERGLVIELDP